MKAELWEGCSSTWLKGLNKAELSDVGAEGLAAPGFITEGADTPVTFKARNPQRSEAYKMRWSSGACSRIRLNTYLTGLMLWKKRFCPSLLSKNSVSSVEQPWVFPQTASCLFSLTTLHITFWEELCVFFSFIWGWPWFCFFPPWLLTFSDRLLTDRAARLTRQSHLGDESDTGPMWLCWFSVFSPYKQLYPFAPVHPRDLSLTARRRLDQRACHACPSLPPKCQITAWCGVYFPITAQASHFSKHFTW